MIELPEVILQCFHALEIYFHALEIYWPVVAAIFFILRKSVALYCLSYLTFIPGAGLPENYDGGGGGG